MHLFATVLTAVLLHGQVADRPDFLLADFEGKDYGAWTKTGEAFGTRPAQGTLPGQMQVSGYMGQGLVNSFYKGDATTGTLTSPPFTVSRKFINFLIGGGAFAGQTCVNLLVDGKQVRTATGPNTAAGGSERLDWQTWSVADLEGKTARIEIVDNATGGWGHINVDQITLSDKKEAEEISTAELYNETYRPQFHFTAKAGWLNDPNGMVYHNGEYHLFFQHNPKGTQWGNMTWGHAVSKDMVHWQQIANALEPDSSGTMFSGSAVVDKENTSGFKVGQNDPIIAIYTAAGGTNPESKGVPFTQRIAYSTDEGRSWTKYSGNPVLPHQAGENRDPKVIWHAPTNKWIMALYLDGEEFGIFSSPNLKDWTRLQTLKMAGCSECPDFFDIPVKGESGTRKWVFTSANGHYLVGTFDGSKFTQELGPITADYGANYYAVQTYSDIPESDGRRIQIAWMTGGSYPKMPFNQQMSFPCEMTLRKTSEGLRIYRWPVKEITRLYDKDRRDKKIQNQTIKPGDNSLGAPDGDLLDIDVEFDLKDSSEVGLRIRGELVTYSAKDKKLRCLGREAPLEPEKGRVKIRILVDRTSLEVFGNQGRVSLTSCFLPRQQERGWYVYAKDGAPRVVSLTAHRLTSAWPGG